MSQQQVYLSRFGTILPDENSVSVMELVLDRGIQGSDPILRVEFSRDAEGNLHYSVIELAEDDGLVLQNMLPEYFV